MSCLVWDSCHEENSLAFFFLPFEIPIYLFKHTFVITALSGESIHFIAMYMQGQIVKFWAWHMERCKMLMEVFEFLNCFCTLAVLIFHQSYPTLCKMFNMTMSAHWSVFAKSAVYDCGFELVQHLAYSPHLPPQTWLFLPNMKKRLIINHILSCQ